ncbi:MAG: hypothetical protein WCF67_10405 [Chitinophagaceae bacterium]
MIEKHSINGQDVWLEVEPYHVKRDNPKTIPTEYFTARYYLQEPVGGESGKIITQSDGNPKLFESPVAALEFVNGKLLELM